MQGGLNGNEVVNSSDLYGSENSEGVKNSKLIGSRNHLLFAQPTPHDVYKFCTGRYDSADGAPDNYFHVDAIVQAS